MKEIEIIHNVDVDETLKVLYDLSSSYTLRHIHFAFTPAEKNNLEFEFNVNLIYFSSTKFLSSCYRSNFFLLFSHFIPFHFAFCCQQPSL